MGWRPHNVLSFLASHRIRSRGRRARMGPVGIVIAISPFKIIVPLSRPLFTQFLVRISVGHDIIL